MFLLVSKFKMIGIAIEHCAQSKNLTKTYNKGFANHSTLINYRVQRKSVLQPAIEASCS